MSFASRFTIGLALLASTLPLQAAEPVNAAPGKEAPVMNPGNKKLEEELLEQAPKLIQQFQDRGYRNVGVLKFAVKLGEQSIDGPATPLNTRLAEKVELALIVASKPHDSKHLRIIHNASATAATIRGANHVTAAGRPLLFEEKYPLAWGTEQVTPDVFITGIAAVDANLQTMSVHLQSFDKNSKELKKLASFDVAVDLDQLLDTGESFNVRGVFDGGKVEHTSAELREQATAEAVKTALIAKTEANQTTKPTAAKRHPLAPGNTDTPVTFEVRYDGRPQQIVFLNGSAFLPEPKENQVVTLVVRRGNATSRLGVVVKVNGENTLFRERLADLQCTKWIFEEDMREFGLYGFQLNGMQRENFKVLSTAASQKHEMDYGADVGLISITVFREEKELVKSKPVQISKELDILKRNQFPTKTKNTLAALQAELEASFDPPRGIILNGKAVGQKIDTVPFRASSIPTMSATIRYYSPQDPPK